jgi:heme-degrading monooxygenase HmoA
MVRATLTVRVRSGGEAAFEQAWRRVAAEVRRAPGNLRQALLRDPQDARTLVITSDWTSASAFRAFERSAAQDELTAPLRRLRESASMSVHAVVHHVEAEPVA